MNAESRPLKQHDHPQYYVNHRAVAAAEAEAPCRTTTTTTTTTTRTTTIVTRRRALAVGVVVVAAVVAGVTYRSTGLDPRSPSGATGGVVLREGSTTMGTKALDNDTDGHHHDDEPLTREAFIARYPELMDISPEHQTVQYEAYLLYLNGMTVKELDAYYDINDDGQQEGGGRAGGATTAVINGGQQEGGRAGATSVFKCCLDDVNSCAIRFQEVIDQVRANEMSLPNNVVTQDDVCAWVSRENPDVECVPAGYAKYRICCRSFPDSRVGSKFWVFNGCT